VAAGRRESGSAPGRAAVRSARRDNQPAAARISTAAMISRTRGTKHSVPSIIAMISEHVARGARYGEALHSRHESLPVQIDGDAGYLGFHR